MKTPFENKLDRREFLKTSGVVFSGLTFLSELNFAQGVKGLTESQRRVFPLNHKWLYSEKITPDSTSLKFDDCSFVRVMIPHTNNTNSNCFVRI